jgi:heme O synthase-like polyprenyltransferase
VGFYGRPKRSDYMQGLMSLILGAVLIVAGLAIDNVAMTVIGFLLIAVLIFRIVIYVVAIRRERADPLNRQ